MGVQLIDGTSITKGDVGIIIENELVAEEHFFTNFDYKILMVFPFRWPLFPLLELTL